MDKVAEPLIQMFRPPNFYFWNWVENNKAIEWRSEFTICFRPELIGLLYPLCESGIPPMGSILFVLAACRDDWEKTGNGMSTLQCVKMLKDSSEMNLHEAHGQILSIKPVLDDAMRMLDLISKINRKFRTGDARSRLLQTVLMHATEKKSGSEAKLLLSEFQSGQFDELLSDQAEKLTVERFKSDLLPLQKAFQFFRTTESLETHIRTGVIQLPAPAEFETPAEDHQASDLLEQLSQNPKTIGLARLTQRLIAAINIPIHAVGSSDQSFGGVSDITNRGEFDRLLLSELAHEDLILMARLANNEALYLRREELPSDKNQKRFILIDATIRMWGKTRVFAMAAALTCVKRKKENTSVQAFVFGGGTCFPVDLESVSGVINALEQLDPALHCGESLTRFFKERDFSGGDEHFFITDEENVFSPQFLPFLTEVQPKLNYIISLGKDGGLNFSEFIAGRRKLLSTAKLDLNELLFPATHRSLNDGQANPGEQILSSGAPAFFKQKKAPLYLPPAKILINNQCTFSIDGAGIFIITQDQRLLWWEKSKDFGAIELLSIVEKGNYCLEFDGIQTAFLLIQALTSQRLKLYRIDLQTHVCTQYEFTEVKKTAGEMYFVNNIFYLDRGRTYSQIDTGGQKAFLTVYENSLPKNIQDAVRQIKEKRKLQNVFHLAGHVNRQKHTLTKASRIYINQNCELSVDGRVFAIRSTALMFENFKNSDNGKTASENTELAPATQVEKITYKFYNNFRVQFTRFAWPDGSYAVLDSRGLIHLVSSDKLIAEISIILLADGAVSAWTSDNRYYGSKYFIGGITKDVLSAHHFVNYYLKTFIKKILQQ